jgi:hypothetical protein
MLIGGVSYREKAWVAVVTGNVLGAWRKIPFPARLYALSPHPKHPDWIAGLGEVDCRDPLKNCYNELYYTTDFGDTWTPVWTYIKEFSWADAGVSGNHDNQLYVVDWEDKRGSIRSKTYEPKRLLKTTTFFRGPAGQQYSKINDGIVDFLSVGDDLMVWKRLGTGVVVFTSVDGGETWHTAKFPSDSQIENVRTLYRYPSGIIQQ